jgi:hypothetical protein
MNFLDLKMMSTFEELPALLQRRSSLQSRLSQLTPGQFQIANRLRAQIQALDSKIKIHQQPSVVNVQHYSPPDSAFIPHNPQANKILFTQC